MKREVSPYYRGRGPRTSELRQLWAQITPLQLPNSLAGKRARLLRPLESFRSKWNRFCPRRKRRSGRRSAKPDAVASGERSNEPGGHPARTRRDGGFCDDTCGLRLVRTRGTAGAGPLGLLAKSPRQNRFHLNRKDSRIRTLTGRVRAAFSSRGRLLLRKWWLPCSDSMPATDQYLT